MMSTPSSTVAVTVGTDRVFGPTPTAIINDDTDAFSRQTTMGGGSPHLESDHVTTPARGRAARDASEAGSKAGGARRTPWEHSQFDVPAACEDAVKEGFYTKRRRGILGERRQIFYWSSRRFKPYLEGGWQILVRALFAEPPLRLAVKAAMKMLPVPTRAKALWDAVDRPQYLVGVLYAADQAKREGRDAISVVEFGVAEGYGLLALQAHAAVVERETGVQVHVYGFDRGSGLPQGTGDYRDHPDVWQPGDYAMDVPALKAELSLRTMLVLGDIEETARRARIAKPVGFMAIDVDFYSSTVAALRVLKRPDVERLWRVALYFDDLAAHYNHRFAGELLAIEEFNTASTGMKIDRWRGLRSGRPFPDAPWLDSMYLAHDLEAIGRVRLTRPSARMR